MGVIRSRAELSSQLGLSFNGKRDMYESCGYLKHLTFEDYRDAYDRADIASTIVSAKPDATWVDPPLVREDKPAASKRNTPFEKAFTALAKDLSLYSTINRADTLAGIGEYGILFLGFSDGKSFDRPVTGKRNKLLFVRPFSQGSVTIESYDNDIKSTRFGLPVTYSVTLNDHRSELDNPQISATGATTMGVEIHWTRIIHIADNKDESEVFGVPRLKPLMNRIYDVQKILGCSAEMFWQGAFQGLVFNADSGAAIVDADKMTEDIEKYVHGMQRYLKTQGLDTKTLSSMVANPQHHIAVQLQFIAGTTRTPLRILTGSERGELASVQDEYNWKDRINERRARYGTDEIMTPLIDRLVLYGAIPAPKNEYYLDWSDISATTRKQKMETGRIITDSMRMYVESGSYKLVSPEVYLEKVLGFSKEEVVYINPGTVEDLLPEEPVEATATETPDSADRSASAQIEKKSGEEITDDRKFVEKPK